METGPSDNSNGGSGGLSSEKREDIWALLIALIVMIASMIAPAVVHSLFKHDLFIF